MHTHTHTSVVPRLSRHGGLADGPKRLRGELRRWTFRIPIRTDHVEPSLIERGGFETCEFAPLSSETSVFELELDRARWLRNLRIRATLERNQRFRA